MKIGIISQARMTSTRLPGKILLKAGGQVMLKHHVNRLAWSGLPIYIATTTNETDDPVVAFAELNGISFFRGDEENVLSRYYGCAKENGLDVIVRVTSDCPLIDGDLIKSAVNYYKQHYTPNLYVSNALERTYPRGLDFEIFSFALLEEAFQNATLLSDIEHVTPYIHQNRSGKVEFHHIKNETDKSAYRITLDTEDDFKLIKTLFEEYSAAALSYKQLISLLDYMPDLVAINAHIEQKKL
ncbi:glycosyltransferase family protein [Solitalea sp. MAHUQ-68]|uniref:Glycosyltransferase family protein n=1 Tax=Solitalea agri TaxID=2953739 RepID=A0A9X2F2H9_9SPHI|nr:glycosyltransferase family protein [Solitalea agri]MCO4292939.1 glycosyltransferase family protein [Solitalea agri]